MIGAPAPARGRSSRPRRSVLRAFVFLPFVFATVSRARRARGSVGSGAGRSRPRSRSSTCAPLVGRALERLHHLEHVQGQLAARPVRPARADGVRHVGDADDAVVAVGIGVLGRRVPPVLPASRRSRSGRRTGWDRARSGVASRAVDLDRPWRCVGTSKLMAIVHDGAARRIPACPRHGSRPRPGSSCPCSGSLVIVRCGAARVAIAGDARDRPEQVDEVGDVVGPHVEHRAAARGVVEGRARVPALVAGAHEEGGAGDRLADRALVDRACGRSGARRRGRCRARSRRAGRARCAASTSAAAPRQRRSPSGFSEWTCLPAASACRPTSTCAAGTVRLTTISIAGSASSSSTLARRQRRTRCARASAASGLRSATPLMSRIGKSCAALR